MRRPVVSSPLADLPAWGWRPEPFPPEPPVASFLSRNRAQVVKDAPMCGAAKRILDEEHDSGIDASDGRRAGMALRHTISAGELRALPCFAAFKAGGYRRCARLPSALAMGSLARCILGSFVSPLGAAFSVSISLGHNLCRVDPPRRRSHPGAAFADPLPLNWGCAGRHRRLTQRLIRRLAHPQPV